MRHLNRPEPNSTPEAAMELLLQKARLVGDQEWNADVGGPRVRDRHPRASHHPLHLARRGVDAVDGHLISQWYGG